MPPETAQEAGGDGLAARQAAFSLLNEIFFRRRSFDEAMTGAQGFGDLPARDRAFVRLLVATVLKRTRQMDAVLAHFLHEPFDALKPAGLINVFRLGIAQLAFLGTPQHAAVNTTVELAAAEGIAHQKALVNAVMRRLAREGFPEMSDRDAGRFNTPEWLWNAWMKDYGVETALDIAAANLGEASLDISVKSDPRHWAEKLGATVLPTGTLRKPLGGFIPDMPGYAEGAWWIQNAAAALPAKLLGDVKDKTVVDLCAAPGGKTAQLAEAGAKVIAIDRSAQRVVRLKENMQRLRLDVETVIADGATWRPPASIDAVLLDAPCTATGTIRHQPDILHLKEPKDQEKLVALQRRLLRNAVEMLKPGGMLIYCTCSIQKAESEDQAEWVLSQGLPLQRTPVTHNEIPELLEMVTERGEIRCLPGHWRDFNGIDGFFVARFARV